MESNRTANTNAVPEPVTAYRDVKICKMLYRVSCVLKGEVD